MRAVDASLAAHLSGGATTLCHCWRITRRDGFILGFTDHDRPINFDGTDFAPETGAEASALSTSADLAVDNSSLVGALSSSALSSTDLAGGRYDGAQIELWRVNWAAPDERLLLKSGVIGEITRSGDGFTAEMRGPAHALDQETGRVYQRQCDADLGDARCGVAVSSPQFEGNGAVVSVADESRITVSGLSAFVDGWFAHGVLDWTSGPNLGVSQQIKAHGAAGSNTALAFWLPAPFAIKLGDAFTIKAGCDKTHGTCAVKFNNLVNFRGFHLMPGNDFVVRYPARDDENGGGSLS